MSAVLPAPFSSLHPSFADRDFFRMSVDAYEELGERGVLAPDDRVELIDGYLVVKPMQNSPHSSTVDRLGEDLIKLVPDGWRVRIQLPLKLKTSVPEPDAVIARGDRRTFDQRHPIASEVGLVVEVSDSSLSFDRDTKGRDYARAGIPEYWIVNLVASTVEVSTGPTADNGYTNRREYTTHESVPLALDGAPIASIPVRDLLP